MLKFKKLVVVSLLTLSTTLRAITEGVEYTKLKGNEMIQGADDKIIELFSYACIHCYNHFKIGTLKFVSEFLPEFKYEEWQVKQMGEFGYQIAEILAYAKMIDEKNFINNSLNEKSAYHQVMKAYFEEYFKYRQRWGTQETFYEVGANAIKEFRLTKNRLKEYENDKMFLIDTIKHEQDLYESICDELLDFEI